MQAPKPATSRPPPSEGYIGPILSLQD